MLERSNFDIGEVRDTFDLPVLYRAVSRVLLFDGVWYDLAYTLIWVVMKDPQGNATVRFAVSPEEDEFVIEPRNRIFIDAPLSHIMGIRHESM